MPDSNLPKRVKLERVESGYRYDLGDKFTHGLSSHFEIQKIDHPGATFNGWWEVYVQDIHAGGVATGLFQSLDEVRIFLGALPCPQHRWGS